MSRLAKSVVESREAFVKAFVRNNLTATGKEIQEALKAHDGKMMNPKRLFELRMEVLATVANGTGAPAASETAVVTEAVVAAPTEAVTAPVEAVPETSASAEVEASVAAAVLVAARSAEAALQGAAEPSVTTVVETVA